MARPKVFSSLDYDNDKNYQNLLRAWNANPEFEFTWNETSPRVAINSRDADALKATLSRMINEATHLLCIVGQHTGRNGWVDWEVRKAIELKKKLVGVKINREFAPPPALLNVGASWAMSFNQDAILRAIRSA